MNKIFSIYSEIVDDGGKWSMQDVCPSDFRKFTDELSTGDEVTLHINSVGGSVLAGVSIANQIKALNAKGIHTTARIEGLCASIATVIMCACEKIVMDDTSFIMIHNCWTFAEGDSNELRKQADVMDTMNDVMMTFYKSKFGLTEEELKKLMDAETWFSGNEAKDFKLACEVIEGQTEYKIAASLKRFKNIPQRILNMNRLDAHAEVNNNEVEETTVVTAEAKTAEHLEEQAKEIESLETEVNAVANEDEVEDENEDASAKSEDVDQDDIEELRKTIEILKEENAQLKSKPAEIEGQKDDEDCVTRAECEKRVSGMQAKLQLQINDFKSQLQAKEEELIKAKAEVTNLTENLKTTSDELSKMTSAFEEKTKALDMLNANVNAHAEELPTMEEGLAKCASPAEKVAFLTSGKYVKVR